MVRDRPHLQVALLEWNGQFQPQRLLPSHEISHNPAETSETENKKSKVQNQNAIKNRNMFLASTLSVFGALRGNMTKNTKKAAGQSTSRLSFQLSH